MWSTKYTLLLLASLIITPFAQANLILNGDFEDNTINSNSWRWFTSDQINGWNGSNIEIWNQFNGVTAYSGNQHIELNAHPSNGNPFSIFQSFATEVGSTYQLSFAYRARSSHNESFKLDVKSGNSSLISSLMTEHTTSQWHLFSQEFTATDILSNIRFTSVIPSTGTVGNFIDTVSVVKVNNITNQTEVPEPISAALFIFGLAWLSSRVRGNRNAHANDL